MEAAESGLYCVNCDVDGVELTVVGRKVVGEYVRGRKERIAR